MRSLLLLVLLILYSCNRKNYSVGIVSSCQLNREEAFDDYRSGVFRFINGEPLRYESELRDLLNQSRIDYSVDPFGHACECYDLVMDSLLKIRFGDTFIDKLKLGPIACSSRVDNMERLRISKLIPGALRKGNDDQLGGDFIINYLNDRLPSETLFSFVSNTVERPFYLIEFTVDKNGSTKCVGIKERNNTANFKEAEAILLNELNNIKDWIPATIRSRAVGARFQMGVAIESK